MMKSDRALSIGAVLSGGLRAPGLPTLSSLRLIDLLRKSPAPAGFFYMSSRWILVTGGSAVVGGAISMESPGAGPRRVSPAAIRAAQQYLAGLADVRILPPMR